MDGDLPLPPPPSDKARDTRARITAGDAPAAFSFNEPQLNLDQLSAPPSSDPPLFSSDDFQSSALENYGHSPGAGGCSIAGQQPPPRPSLRKRRYRGTWWGEQLHAKRKRRTQFKDKRFVDSGVWIGSEGSATDYLPTSDDVSCEPADSSRPVTGNRGEDAAVARAKALPPKPQIDSLQAESRGRPVRLDKTAESEAHTRARATILNCLEDGNENVDLSYYNLETIPPGLLRPLIQLTKEPLAIDPPSTEDVYSPLEPSLRLFLTRNLLTSLPGEVFELERLRVLSLRHNNLTEIPCAIRNLTMLQDLNVAGNHLKYLPWEILYLMQTGDLRHLTVHPNPFAELDENDIAQWHCRMGDENGDEATKCNLKAPVYRDTPPPEAWRPLQVATGKVQYLDMEGRPIKDANTISRLRETNGDNCAVHSLRELSLRACTRSAQLTRFLDSTDPDELLMCCPDPVLRLLTMAKRVKDAGGNQCSVCSRSFVIPRTQWVEWWDCIPFENGSKGPRKSGQDLEPLPFLRRGCSWACRPGPNFEKPSS